MGLLDDAIREHLDLKRKRGADPGEIEKLERDALGPVRRTPSARAGNGVPHLEVHHDAELRHDSHEDETVDAPQAKRGFLRRNRPAVAADSVDHEEPFDPNPGSTYEDRRMPDEPSAYVEPLDRADDPFADDAHGHDEQPEHEEPAAATPAAESPRATPATQPPADADPPHLIFDSEPPKRPTFAPAAPASPQPVSEPAPAEQADATAQEHAVTDDASAAATPRAPKHAQADAARETREWSVEEAFAAEDARHQTADPAAGPDDDVLEETPEFLQDTPDHDRLWFEQRPPRDFDFDG